MGEGPGGSGTGTGTDRGTSTGTGCVEDDRWGVRSLAESMLTFGSTRCSNEVRYLLCPHLYFHADTRLPEACFLHGRVPPGADPYGNIKGAGLVDDLRHRQNRRLADGGDPH